MTDPKKKILLFLLCLPLWSSAQSVLEQKCDLKLSQVPITQALEQLSKNCGLDLVYSERFFKGENPVSLQANDWTIDRILEKILAKSDVEFRELNGQLVFYIAEKKKVESYTLNGYIEDAVSGERLIAATVYCAELGRGTITNEYGFFSLSLPEGSQKITINYLGYQELERQIELTESRFLHLSMQPALTLAEILVTPTLNQEDLLPSPYVGTQLTTSDFIASPDMGGESDLLRMIQLLPGIQTGADGFGGLNVRGGDSAHNLVLLDGVPVYNPAHFLGLLSIFNTAAVKNAQVIKSGIPARYGGRLSSVVDVRTKEGSSKKLKAEAGANFISARGSVEVPFNKGKGTLLLAARKSVDDFLLANVIQRSLFLDTSEIFGNYRFSDFNWKVSYEFSDKNRWFLSYYRGWDEYRSDLVEDFFIDDDEIILAEARDETQLTWGNHVASLRWNHVFNPRTFSNTTLTLTKYEFLNANFGSISAVEEEFEEVVDFGYYYGLGSGVLDVSLSSDFEVTRPPNHYLRFGFGAIYHSLSPEQTFTQLEFLEDPDFDSLNIEDVVERTIDQQSAIETSWYIEDEFKVGQNWHFNAGLRLSAFIGGESFFTPEPRLSARYRLNNRWQLTAAIDRTAQYLHRLNYSEINLPSDVWVSSDFDLKPERSWQGSLGASGTFEQGLSLSVEGFAKKFKDVRSFIFFAIDTFESEIEFVPNIEGTSYGLEFFLRRTGQRTGGWLSYTWSKADREINDEGIVPQKYSFQYDRRHDLKLFFYLRFTDRWQLGLNWVYGSPQPRLLSDEETVLGAPPSPEAILPYPFRQPARLEPYHRLDLSASYSFKGKYLEHTLKLSVYNLYDRKNTAFYRVSPTKEDDPIWMLPQLFGLFYGAKF